MNCLALVLHPDRNWSFELFGTTGMDDRIGQGTAGYHKQVESETVVPMKGSTLSRPLS